MTFTPTQLRLTLAVAGLLLALCGCRTTAFTPYVDTGVRIDRAVVLAEARAAVPGAAIEGLSDNTYTVVSAAWLVANLGNFRAWAFDYLPAYQGESLDCENFARILREVVAVQAGRARVPAAPLVAAASVHQRTRWANVPGSEAANHALNAVVTDRGIYIIEPQSLTGNAPKWAPLAQYPNPIYRLSF